MIEDISRPKLNDGVHLLLLANIQQAIRDAAEIYARASVLFPFARGSATEHFDIPLHYVKNALIFAGCFDLPEIDAMAEMWQRDFQLREETRQSG